MKIRLFCSLY